MAYARNLIVLLPMLALLAAPAHGAETLPAGAEWDRCVTYSSETGEEEIDPVCFFEKLIARYRCLEAYEDIARVIQITQRSGEEPLRIETLIGCEIQDGRLLVETSAAQVRRTVGLDVHFRQSPAMESAELRYKMWLAPHMALRFTDEPEREFRPGVQEGFRPTEAKNVTIDEKPMVHLQLESGDGMPPAAEAHFDLYVDPESMLIKRITGQERLPDGASYETRLEITPISAEDAGPRPDEVDEPTAAPAEVAGEPAGAGRSVDPGPRLRPDQAGGGAAPPTAADPPAKSPGTAARETEPPPGGSPQNPPGAPRKELGKPGDANLKPPAKGDAKSRPPTADDDDGPRKREREPPASSSPPPGNVISRAGH